MKNKTNIIIALLFVIAVGVTANLAMTIQRNFDENAMADMMYESGKKSEKIAKRNYLEQQKYLKSVTNR